MAAPRSRPRSACRPAPRSLRWWRRPPRPGWPGNSAFSRAITLRHIQRMSWMPSITDLSSGKSTTSRAVTTALTPGSASAFEVSIDLMRACGCGLRKTLPQIMPGMVVSAAKAARPVTLSTPSGRMVRWPIHLLLVTIFIVPPCCSRMSAAVSSTARTILSYPVHRHRLPASQNRTSSSLGCEFLRSNASDATSMPDVQMPHCSAAVSRNFCCSGCN